jgi:hypothetical protein
MVITFLCYIFRPDNRFNAVPLFCRIVEQAIREIPLSNATCFCIDYDVA